MGTWKKLAYFDDIVATKLDDFTAPDNNTDLNASASAHGLSPKLSGVATEFLNGDGAFSVPAGGGPTIVPKTADEPLDNSTVLQNDDELKLTVAANEKWLLEFFLYVTHSFGWRDMKWALTVPNGASIAYGQTHEIATVTTATDTGTATAGTALTVDIDIVTSEIKILHLRGIVAVGATAGNVQLQWAAVSAGNPGNILTVKANSCLIAHKLA